MRAARLPTLLSHAKRSFWLFFGGIWLSVGLVMFVAAIGMALEERSWDTAVRTSGMVLTKDIVQADSESSTQYRVRFRFSTEDGRTIEGDEEVEVATWEALSERGPIDVYYRPTSPTSARLEPGADPFGALMFLAFGLVFGGIGGVLFGRAVIGLLRARRLLASGIDAEATVMAVEQTNVSFNRRPQYRVRYSYRDGAGREHAGDSGYLDWDEASTWSEGDRAAIRYDPRRPVESLWVGRIEKPTPIDDAPPRVVDASPPAAGAPPPA
jgi:uncharacterized protein DUF3592